VIIPPLLIALAQTPSIGLDILRPHFNTAETSLLSVAAFASGGAAVGPAHLVFELPYFRVDPSPPAPDGPTSTLGNPYVGIEFGGQGKSNHVTLSATAGVRLPLLTDTDAARTIGSYVDVSRFEAFRPNTLSIHSSVRFYVQNTDGFFVAASGGPTAWVPTQQHAQTELVLHHELSVGHRGSAAWFAAGYTGLSVLTEPRSAVGEFTIGEFVLSIGRARGRVRPAFHLMLPLDEEYSAVVGYVAGLGVAMQL
jgi:hypothetical protein